MISSDYPLSHLLVFPASISACSARLSFLTWQGLTHHRGLRYLLSEQRELNFPCQVLAWTWEEDAQMLCYRGLHFILQGNPSFHCLNDAHRVSFRSVGTRRLAGAAPALNRACQARGRTSTCCAARGRWGACRWRPRHLNGGGSSWNPGRCTPHRSQKRVLLGSGQQAPCQAPKLLGSATRALGPLRRNPLPSLGK